MTKHELANLMTFARTVIGHAWDGYSMDGGEVQDLAIKLGLIVETTYDPKRHGPTDYDIPPGEYFTEYAPHMRGDAPQEVSP